MFNSIYTKVSFVIRWQWKGIVVVEKFHNSKGSRFSDMPVMVSGADLNRVVMCNIAIWVCAVCLVLIWMWLIPGAVRSGAVLWRYFLPPKNLIFQIKI